MYYLIHILHFVEREFIFMMFWVDSYLEHVFIFLKLLNDANVIKYYYLHCQIWLHCHIMWLVTAYKLWKYADPIGAILICIYILVSWFHMGCGKSGFILPLCRCTIVCLTFKGLLVFLHGPVLLRTLFCIIQICVKLKAKKMQVVTTALYSLTVVYCCRRRPHFLLSWCSFLMVIQYAQLGNTQGEF